MDGMIIEQSGPGVLYLCGTPIGNLEDMTYRAVRIMTEAGLIAAEDTRHTRKLLAHYDIHTPLTSYHEHNKFTKGPELIAYLLRGDSLVCVSDAGLPGIADPGTHLAQLAIEAGIQVVPLPGANAALSALICSGLDTTVFTFVGFLPKTDKKRREVLKNLQKRPETLLFYEAPHRLKMLLRELVAAMGGSRCAAVARELTKKFEEFRRGTLEEHLAYFMDHEPRGEFVVVVAGTADTEEQETDPGLSPAELVKSLMDRGIEKKEAMRQTARQMGISRREVYQLLLPTEQKEDVLH